MDELRYPLRAVLKSGRPVFLRPLQHRDEAELAFFFSELPRECTEFLKDDVHDPEVVRGFIRQCGTDRVYAILALTEEDRVVGDGTLHMNLHGWRRHVGEVRVVVSPEFQRQGLATALIRELVNQASVLGLKKLEAQILDSQEGARIAFEQLGFREEARLRAHALDVHNRLHDLLILTHNVDDPWLSMEILIEDLDFSRDLEGY